MFPVPPQGLIATIAEGVDFGTSDPAGFNGRLFVRTDTNALRFFSSGAWRSATGVVVGDANTWTALQTFDAGITVSAAQNLIAPTIGPAAAQQHTLPAVASDTITLIAATQTLTNKTFSDTVAFTATSPFSVANGQTLTVSVTAQTVGGATLTIPNFANVNDTFVFVTLAQTLSNKTISGGTFSGTIAGTPLFTGTIDFDNTNPFRLKNGQFLTVQVTAQTVGIATMTVPNFAGVNDTFAFITLAQTLANKTLSGPTISGTIAGTYTIGGTPTMGAALNLNGNGLRLGTGAAGEATFGPRDTNQGFQFTFATDAARCLWTDSTGSAVIEITENAEFFPSTTNKTGSIGKTTLRFLDVFTGNAVTTGTSRTVEVQGLFCPKCGVQAKRSTGGVVMNGYNEDYRIAFCPQCFIALIDVVKHQKDFQVPPFEEARFVNIETGSHGGSSNYIFLRFKYKFGNREYTNGTFLSEAERKIMEGADETAKKNLLEYLIQVEWESTYRTEVMSQEVKVMEASYKKNHLHTLLGMTISKR